MNPHALTIIRSNIWLILIRERIFRSTYLSSGAGITKLQKAMTQISKFSHYYPKYSRARRKQWMEYVKLINTHMEKHISTTVNSVA